MYKFSTQRLTRAAAGLIVASAFAVAPMAAQASSLDGTLSAGALSNDTPTFTDFTTALTGLTQTVDSDVGPWHVTDATGTAPGYVVTAMATKPTGLAPDGTTAVTLSGASTETLSQPVVGANALNQATLGPVRGAGGTDSSAGVVLIPSPGVTIDHAAAGRGQGEWDFAADAASLAVVIPGNASAGTYTSTVTFTSTVL